MENVKNKKTLLAGGTIVLAVAALTASLIFFSRSTQAAGSPPEPNNPLKSCTTPLKAKQEGDETPESKADKDVDEDVDEGNTDMRINETRIRWNGEKWEYSTDGGQTWTDTPPDGVKVDEKGDMTMWQGKGDIEDFDIDATKKDIDNMIDSILSDVNERYGDVMPEGTEGGSFFTYGDSIARQVDGIWEFSSDGGKTWTNEPPEGIEISEDGTRLRMGGGEGDINDLDADEWYENWQNNSDDKNDSGATGTAQGMTV